MKTTDKPQLHLVCNAHLDPYWQWEWEEGAAAAVSTFRTAADCCDLSDSFIFCHNEVILYQWVETFEPELFKRIRRLVKAGRWHIMGGWFLQPDCNMPCGESFVRQMLIGKRWFLEKFGVEPRTAINVDSFGHTRGLVQILRKGGYDSYIALRLGDSPQPPPEFIWVGYDGSEIIVKRDECWYSTPLGEAAEKVREVKEQFRRGRPVTLRLWGVGNHGGGPSRKDVADLDAYIAATTDCEIKHSTPEAFFDALRASGVPLPRVERDLNPTMVGCYTSQVRIKQKHRLLKWSVPTRLSGSRCLGQVACGIESLPVTGDELVSQQWLMVVDDERRLALSVANDGLYGSDCKDGELRLSLVRSPTYCGHPIGDRPIVPQDRFLPRIDQGERLYTFRINASGLEERLADIGREALVLNQKPMALSFFPSGHGESPQPGAQVDDPVVQVQAAKQAEDGAGWIVRLFNASASTRTVRLSIPPLAVKIRVRLGCYELKTLRVARKGDGPAEADLIERPLSGAKRGRTDKQ